MKLHTRFNTDSMYDAKFRFGLALLVTAIVIGIIFSNGCAKPAPAKPSPVPADAFQSPSIPGIPQADTDELLAQWNRAEKKQAEYSAELISYNTLMTDKMKKAREGGAKGFDEGMAIVFEAVTPCMPLDGGGTKCTQQANVIAPKAPAAVVPGKK